VSLSMNVPKISFVCLCSKFCFFKFQDNLMVLIRGLFGKEAINVFSNLKMSLYIETKF